MRSMLAPAVALGLLAAPRIASATVYVDDPLTDANFAGRGSQGGNFGADGWTTSGGTDAIWYEIPDALPSGSIAYSVLGVSVNGSLSGADHDIFAMYQAPSGQAEPVAYSPYFRNNDFKVFTRIFGVQEPGRAGAMKIEFFLCPRGDPWYHDDACPPGCGVDGLAYANGIDHDIGWDAATWYRLGVSWGSGMVSFSRDGAVLGTVPYDGTYAPQPLRVRLGSPRDGISEFAYMPSGLTFKDVHIEGDAGAMTPVCGMELPDAGAPPDAGGEDAGLPAGELGVLQDVTGAAWSPDVVFDDVTDLNVEATPDGQPGGVVYLRFPPIAGQVQQALLRLHTQAYPSAAGGSGVVHPVADGSWSETTLTWNNRPAWGADGAGAAQSVMPDSEVEWDVTSLVAAGNVNLAIVSADPDGAHYMSKEAGDPTKAPRLVVQVQPIMSGAGGGGGAAVGAGGAPLGAGGADLASGAGGATSASHGAGGAPSASPSDGALTGGCSCRIAGGGRAKEAAIVPLLAALSLARRKRRQPPCA